MAADGMRSEQGSDPVTRIAEIQQENRGGDVSSRDIEWLCEIAYAAHQVRRSSFPDSPGAFTVQERRLVEALDGR